MIQILIACLLLGVHSTQMLLKKARHLVKGMPYNQEQKTQLARAAINVLKVFPVD